MVRCWGVGEGGVGVLCRGAAVGLKSLEAAPNRVFWALALSGERTRSAL